MEKLVKLLFRAAFCHFERSICHFERERGICCRDKSPLIPLPAYRRQVAKGEIGGFIEERFLPSVEMTKVNGRNDRGVRSK
ncbi:MAG: hypothetical protein ABII25_08100 [bacterium]